ncbi:MAG: hypothetical protein WCL00_15395, partial [Bacteroidota bacterium]
GYNVYRSEGGSSGPWVKIRHLAGPDSLFCVDVAPVPGIVCYRVTAYYDLTVYGFPGQFDESLPYGSQCVTLHFGTTLPFCEHWDGGSFGFNQWIFDVTGQGNWIINSGVGYPAPGADFSWQPVKTNYDYSIESPMIDATLWSTCLTISLEFDYKLVDRNATSNEKLAVEVFYSNSWHKNDEFVNNGNVDWTHKTYAINGVLGKSFRVRFRANGANSADMLYWYVDNICVYGSCNPPLHLLENRNNLLPR